MIDWTKPVQIRKGQPVTILTTKGRTKDYPIMGYIGEDIRLYLWKEDGSFPSAEGSTTKYDLINVPPPPVLHKRYVVWWKLPSGKLQLHDTTYDQMSENRVVGYKSLAGWIIVQIDEVTYTETPSDE